MEAVLISSPYTHVRDHRAPLASVMLLQGLGLAPLRDSGALEDEDEEESNKPSGIRTALSALDAAAGARDAHTSSSHRESSNPSYATSQS